jgi:FHS family L-fucose permease-like MFS transporter
VAFAVIIGVNYIKMSAEGNPQQVSDLFGFSPMILVIIVAFFLANEKPARTMMLFGTMAAIMMLIGLVTSGKIALYAFVSGGLFCSVMWPCIFSLSIAGLGKYTSQGSSLLIMMIAGAAAIPPLQGLICDTDKISPGIFGISWTHFSYIVPLLGFSYLAFYGWKVKSVLKAQGIDYDAQTEVQGH